MENIFRFNKEETQGKRKICRKEMDVEEPAPFRTAESYHRALKVRCSLKNLPPIKDPLALSALILHYHVLK